MVNDNRDEDHHEQHDRKGTWGARSELLHHVSAVLEPLMVGLGIVFLLLLLMEFAGISIVIGGRNRLADILQAIWVVFLGDFLLRFWIAPHKGAYLRANWFGALSLALPFLRPFRVFRAARALRGFSLVRLLSGVNRGMRALRRITRGRLMLYVAGLTVVVVFAGAIAVQFFDRNQPESPVQTFGDALWWSATLVTTMNSELHVISTEARVIALLQRLYALSIFGYITASIASYLIGVDVSTTCERENADAQAVQRDIQLLRQELADLRQMLSERATTHSISPRREPR